MIVVLGKSTDFSHTLAEQIVRELGEPCECVETMEDLEKQPADALVVTTAPAPQGRLARWITLSTPTRMGQALTAISMALQHREAVLDLASVRFNTVTKTLTPVSGSQEILLTDKEAQLLKKLIDAGGAGASKESLLKDVWDMAPDINTHTLETHIYRLRGKIKELAGRDAIEVIDGGYRLVP
jgi:hypothetical protein